jgi:hypothetical protein
MKHSALIVAVALLTGIAVPAAQRKEFSFPNTRSYGRATIQFRGQGVQVVVNYDYSQRNHTTKWLLIDLGIASRQRFVLHRDHIKVLTPDGREIAVAPQEAIIADSAALTKLLQNASVQRRDVISYFSQRGGGGERIRFQTLPVGGGTVSPEVTVDNDHVSSGPILFANPQGSWDAGTYRLEITNDVANAGLPIKLE